MFMMFWRSNRDCEKKLRMLQAEVEYLRKQLKEREDAYCIDKPECFLKIQVSKSNTIVINIGGV